jgi:hypothetical protein
MEEEEYEEEMAARYSGLTDGVTVVLQWWASCVTVCYSGIRLQYVTVVLCYSGVTVVLQWCYSGVTCVRGGV